MDNQLEFALAFAQELRGFASQANAQFIEGIVTLEKVRREREEDSASPDPLFGLVEAAKEAWRVAKAEQAVREEQVAREKQTAVREKALRDRAVQVAVTVLDLGAAIEHQRLVMMRWMQNYELQIGVALGPGGDRAVLDKKWADEVIIPLLDALRPFVRAVNEACGTQIDLPEGQADSLMFATVFVDEPEDDIDDYLKYVKVEIARGL